MGTTAGRGAELLRPEDNAASDGKDQSGDGRVEETIIYRYIKPGEAIVDVPARDLTKIDLEPLGWQLRLRLRASGLYELVGSDSFQRADKAEAAKAEAEAVKE